MSEKTYLKIYVNIANINEQIKTSSRAGGTAGYARVAFELAARELGAENYQHQQCRRTLIPAGRLLARQLHHSAGVATAPRERRTAMNPRAGHATSPGQKHGPTRITVPQDVPTAGPAPTRNRATVGPTRRPARRVYQLPHRRAPQGSPNAAAAHTLRPARARPAQRQPLSPTRTTELHDAPWRSQH